MAKRADVDGDAGDLLERHDAEPIEPYLPPDLGTAHRSGSIGAVAPQRKFDRRRNHSASRTIFYRTSVHHHQVTHVVYLFFLVDHDITSWVTKQSEIV